MAPAGGQQRRLHTGGAAADDGQLLLALRRSDQTLHLVFQSPLRVDRTDGVPVAGTGHMALIAPQAGHNVLVPALIGLVAPLGVGNIGPGRADEVGLTALDDLLAVIKILAAAHDVHIHIVDARIPKSLADPGCGVQIRDFPKIEVGGLGRVDGAAADLEDIHLSGAQLGQFDLILHGSAALKQVVLPSGNGDLHEEFLAAGLFDGLADHQRESGAVFHAAAELIGALVGQRRQESSGEHQAVGHVHKAAVKAQTLSQLCLLGILLHHLVKKLLGGGLAQLCLGSITGHKLAEYAIRGIITLDDIHIGQDEVERLCSIVVYHIGALSKHMLVLANGNVQREGVGIVGLDRVVALDSDHRRTGFGLVGIVADERLSRPLFRGLYEMRVGRGADQPVTQHHAVDLDRRKQMVIFQ